MIRLHRDTVSRIRQRTASPLLVCARVALAQTKRSRKAALALLRVPGASLWIGGDDGTLRQVTDLPEGRAAYHAALDGPEGTTYWTQVVL